MLAEEMCDRKLPLSKLAEPVTLYPQHLINLRVHSKPVVMSDPAVLAAQKEVDRLINGAGRSLLRESGTEPVVRVMIEAETPALCAKYAAMIADVIKERGHCVE